jgi:alpha-beta hydrolase superfamily lysophospholipase
MDMTLKIVTSSTIINFCKTGVLLLALLSTAMAPLGAAQTVSFTTVDGIIMIGDYHAPANPRKPVVVMLHGLGSSRGEWVSFEKELAAAGFGYFAYDARGHGESTRSKTGTTVNYKYFGPPGPGSPWQAMVGDLDRAVRFLERSKGLKESSLVISGASVGANIALVWASEHPSSPAVLLLSPGIEYAGIETSVPVTRFSNRRIAFAASTNDQYAYQSSRMLFGSIASNPRAAFFTGAAGHGVQMFDGKFEKDLVQWLSK